MAFYITLITLGFVLVSSFSVISFSQSNETLSDGAISNETSSFSSMSRELAENQSESDDQSDEEDDD